MARTREPKESSIGVHLALPTPALDLLRPLDRLSYEYSELLVAGIELGGVVSEAKMVVNAGKTSALELTLTAVP